MFSFFVGGCTYSSLITSDNNQFLFLDQSLTIPKISYFKLLSKLYYMLQVVTYINVIEVIKLEVYAICITDLEVAIGN